MLLDLAEGSPTGNPPSSSADSVDPEKELESENLS